MYIGGFYYQKDCYDDELVKLEILLNKIMDITKNNPSPTILKGGILMLVTLTGMKILLNQIHKKDLYVKNC